MTTETKTFDPNATFDRVIWYAFQALLNGAIFSVILLSMPEAFNARTINASMALFVIGLCLIPIVIMLRKPKQIPTSLPSEPTKVWTDTLATLRAKGWTVAVHNDYRLDGVAHTFWLFTKNGAALKGEGLTDHDALAEVLARVEMLASIEQSEIAPYANNLKKTPVSDS
jgi:hypothetical protein